MEAGDHLYFTGRPCINGHVCPRYSKSGHCTECSSVRSRSPERRLYFAEREETPEQRLLRNERRGQPEKRARDAELKREKRESEEYLEKERAYDKARRSTKEYREYRRNYERALKETSPEYRIRHSIGRGIRKALRNGKGGHGTFSILGYSAADLRAHLEGLFTSGMTWTNYGDWHIDHKIPLSVFNIETKDNIDFKRAWSLENLQPMWAAENVRKGAKLMAPFQPSLALRIADSANDNSTAATLPITSPTKR